MKILGLEKVSFVDFEGKMCATIFTGGCNYRCPFCHNAGIVLKRYTIIDENEVLAYLKERISLLDAVTISGGEPTLQTDLIDFIKKVKSLGYLVKLDTNGTNSEVLKTLIDENLIDYVAVDIKTNFEDYSNLTCVKNPCVEVLKRTLSLLQQSSVDYELRTTLIAEFHTLDTIKRMAEELSGHKRLYLQKFVNSENCLNSESLHPVDKTKALEFAKILSKTIENVNIRGYN